VSTDPIQPPRLSATRWVLRATCVVATFYSASFASHGLLMTGQILSDEFPSGKVQSIEGHTKTGTRVRLESGREIVFSNLVPVRIAVGDHIAKRRESAAYVVNGTPRTDVRWLLREWLLPMRVTIPLVAYLIAGTTYALKYRRTPLGDCAWSDTDPQRPRRPRTRRGLVAAVALTWLLICLLETALLGGCAWGCLRGISKVAYG
jgi:hypothetical protein